MIDIPLSHHHCHTDSRGSHPQHQESTSRQEFIDEQGYCMSMEQGAGNRDFESREQELISKF